VNHTIPITGVEGGGEKRDRARQSLINELHEQGGNLGETRKEGGGECGGKKEHISIQVTEPSVCGLVDSNWEENLRDRINHN